MQQQQQQQQLECPRCNSINTKFCYYNNYNTSQPRHFCKHCRRYWTKGGTLRNIPVGGSTRSRPPPPSSSKMSAIKELKRSTNSCDDATGSAVLGHDEHELMAMDCNAFNGGMSFSSLLHGDVSSYGDGESDVSKMMMHGEQESSPPLLESWRWCDGGELQHFTHDFPLFNGFQ